MMKITNDDIMSLQSSITCVSSICIRWAEPKNPRECDSHSVLIHLNVETKRRYFKLFVCPLGFVYFHWMKCSISKTLFSLSSNWDNKCRYLNGRTNKSQSQEPNQTLTSISPTISWVWMKWHFARFNCEECFPRTKSLNNKDVII